MGRFSAVIDAVQVTRAAVEVLNHLEVARHLDGTCVRGAAARPSVGAAQ
jgi:hypothetical protein